MKLLLNILLLFITAILVLYIATFLDGIHIDSLPSAIITILVISFINAFIRPIVKFISLPITIVTLGLFSLVINALLIMLAAWIVPGFDVDSFLWALAFSVIISIVSAFVNIIKD